MSWPLRKSSSSSLSSTGLNNINNNNNNNNTSSLNLSHAHTASSTSPIASAACNVGPVPRAVQLDFDKEEKKIQQLETTNKKFYKDVKTYVDKIDELNKSETKMINNLSGLASHASILCSNNSTLANTTFDTTNSPIDDDKEFLTKLKLWKDLLSEHNMSCESLKHSCQQQVIEPMKKLNLLFPQVYEAIKRRQQAFNELTKQQHKLDKALEKERTGLQMVRNEQLKNLVFSAKQQFEREHTLLMEELPKLYDSRVDYIRPCVQALLKSQASFYDNYTSFYDAILGCHHDESIVSKQNDSSQNSDEPVNRLDQSVHADSQIEDEIQKCLNEIKSLSIVAGD